MNIIRYKIKGLNSGLQDPSWSSPLWNSSSSHPHFHISDSVSNQFLLCSLNSSHTKIFTFIHFLTFTGHQSKVILWYWPFQNTFYKIFLLFISFVLLYFSSWHLLPPFTFSFSFVGIWSYHLSDLVFYLLVFQQELSGISTRCELSGVGTLLHLVPVT